MNRRQLRNVQQEPGKITGALLSSGTVIQGPDLEIELIARGIFPQYDTVRVTGPRPDGMEACYVVLLRDIIALQIERPQRKAS